MAKIVIREQIWGRIFKKSVDVYFWRGQPVIRKWPRRVNVSWSARQREARANFRASRDYLKLIPGDVRQKWRELFFGKKDCWVDVVTRGVIKYLQEVKKDIPLYLGHTWTKTNGWWRIDIQGKNLGECYVDLITGKQMTRLLPSFHHGAWDLCYKSGFPKPFARYSIRQAYELLTAKRALEPHYDQSEIRYRRGFPPEYPPHQIWADTIAESWQWEADWSPGSGRIELSQDIWYGLSYNDNSGLLRRKRTWLKPNGEVNWGSFNWNTDLLFIFWTKPSEITTPENIHIEIFDYGFSATADEVMIVRTIQELADSGYYFPVIINFISEEYTDLEWIQDGPNCIKYGQGLNLAGSSTIQFAVGRYLDLSLIHI